MKKPLLAMLLISQLGQAAAAEPTPEWARDAVETLQQRGIIKGYPDGSTGGERPVTRNECAELIERLDQERLREEAAFSSKSDLDETREAAGSLVEQIDGLDTRVQNLEEQTDHLDQRKDEVRRPSL
jgi:vacuolar-type H+-ATPase subunit I/STV1